MFSFVRSRVIKIRFRVSPRTSKMGFCVHSIVSQLDNCLKFMSVRGGGG